MSDTRVRATTLFLYNLLPPLLFCLPSSTLPPPLCVLSGSRARTRSPVRAISTPRLTLDSQHLIMHLAGWQPEFRVPHFVRDSLDQRPPVIITLLNNLFPRVRCHGRLLFFLNFPATATTGIPAVTVAHLALLAPSPPSLSLPIFRTRIRV